MERNSNEHWSRLATDDFWNTIGPSDHVVQIYNDEHTFLSSLEAFVTSGFAANDCVVVIATDDHLQALEQRLRFKGHNVFELKLQEQYVALNAEETLNEFMVNNWPDEALFRHTMNRFLVRARTRNRKVRAFGEMVALLSAQGNIAATVKLENLWNKMCLDEAFSLYRAYPGRSLSQNSLESILVVSGSRSKMIKEDSSHHSILYKQVPFVETEGLRTD